MMILETPRALLRQFALADLDALHAIVGDPDVMRWVGNNKPVSREQAERSIRRNLERYETLRYGCYAVIDRSSGQLIGYAGFIERPDAPSQVELIYGYSKSCWGRGLATEIANHLVRYGFVQHQFPSLFATADPDNQASLRILEKLGMRLIERRLDEHGLPELLYSSSPEDWTMALTR